MSIDHPAPKHPVTLLSTPAGTAQQPSPQQIEFVCESHGINSLLRFLGGLCATFGLGQWTAALFTSKWLPLLVCGGLLLAGAAILLGVVASRRRQHGRFVLDRSLGTITQHHGDKLVRSIPFSSVQQVAVPIDYTDGMRIDALPELPRWLIIQAAPAITVRLGKGTLRELQPVLDLLKQWQFPVRSA